MDTNQRNVDKEYQKYETALTNIQNTINLANGKILQTAEDKKNMLTAVAASNLKTLSKLEPYPLDK